MNVASESRSDCASLSVEPLTFTSAHVVGLLSELLVQIKESNRLMTNLAASAAMAVELMLQSVDEDDDQDIVGDRYLDQPEHGARGP